MKSLVFFLAVCGLSSATLWFQPGREYQLSYEGKLMTGLPEMANHYSGVTVKSDVVVQAIDQTTYKIKLQNVRYGKFDEKLSGSDPSNWRTMQVPEPSQVPSGLTHSLETPMTVSVVNGQIQKVIVSSEEPEYVVNFKKALVSLLKIKTPTPEADPRENTITSRTGSLPPFWKVMQEGIDGKCENTYTVNEIPRDMVYEHFAGALKPELCHGKKVYEITKTRDVTKCDQKSAFMVNQPGKFNCPTGNCDGMVQRSSITRYFGCGESTESIQLHGIINDAELRTSLFGVNTEQFVTGTQQYLNLTEVRPIQTPLPTPSNPKSLGDLYYEYSINEMTGSYPEQTYPHDQSSIQDQGLNYLRKQQHRQQYNLSKPQYNPYWIQSNDRSMQPEELKRDIKQKLEEVSQGINEVEQIEKKQLALKLLAVSNAVFYLPTEELVSLYDSLSHSQPETEKVMKTLLIEAASMSGSSSTILFLKRKIEQGQISTIRTSMILASLPQNIKVPTVSLLEEIFELIKSPSVTQHETTRYQGLYSFAKLINKACVSPVGYQMYPVFVYGKFCTPSTQEVTTKYIPYLVSQLQSSRTESEKQAVVLALGLTGHPSVVPTLLPYAEGKAEGCTEGVRTMAIFSLSGCSKNNRDVVLPIYSTLAFNPAEKREVRLSAIAMMLYLQPSTATMQKLAVSTWYEQDQEIVKYIVSSLRSLSHVQPTQIPKDGVFRTLTKQAKLVLPMTKPVPGMLFTTHNQFSADYLKDLEVGYESQITFQNTPSVKTLYGRLQYFLQKFEFTPLEFAVSMQGGHKILSDVYRIISGESTTSTGELHPEWRSLINSLRIQPREETPFGIAGYVNILDNIMTVQSLTQNTVESWKQTLSSYLRNGPQGHSICGRTPVSIQKAFNLAQTKMMIPSDMGLPILMSVQSPTLFTAKGEIEVDCTTGIIPKVKASITKKLINNFYGSIGTICPFTKEVVATGIDELRSVNIPLGVEVEAKPNTSELKVKVFPTKPTTSNIDVFHYHSKPFTCIKSVSDYTPMITHRNVKQIRSYSQPKSLTREIGQPLGLGLRYSMETESDVLDLKTLYDDLSLYKMSPVNIALFGWLNKAIKLNGKPSNRFHRLTIHYSPSQSSTKEVEFVTRLSVASKWENQEPVEHKLKTSQGPKVLKIESLPISSSSQSPSQRKIKSCIEKLSVESAVAFSTSVTATLKGGSPKSFTVHVTGGKGMRMVEQKWNLHVEHESTTSQPMSLCVDGGLTLNPVPIRNPEVALSKQIGFNYWNKIGFGSSCSQYHINIRGSTSVTEEQKQYSRQSEEARKCRGEQGCQGRCQEISCRKQLEQASTLDQVVFQVTSSNLPQWVVVSGKQIESYLKTYLWTYLSTPSQSSSTSDSVQVKLNFHEKVGTVSMTLLTPTETVTFKNIRIPQTWRSVVPFTASKSPVEQIYKKVTGSSYYPRCHVVSDHVQTFDNKTVQFEMDDCWHLLAADCSSEYSHSVAAKQNPTGVQEVKVFFESTQIHVAPKQGYSQNNKQYEITVNGSPVYVSRNQRKTIEVTGHTPCQIFRSDDDVIVVETKDFRVNYDGKKTSVENKESFLQGRHCGICGDSNKSYNADLITPGKCIYKSNSIAALSYRSQTSQCSQLSQQKKEQLSQEQERCVRYEEKKSQLNQVYLSQSQSQCQTKEHRIVYRGDSVCISKIPTIKCGSHCSSTGIKGKMMEFVCFSGYPESRIATRYQQRAQEGQVMPELRNMETKLVAYLEDIPTSCGH